MALTKSPVPINFAQGLDQKTDPFQVPPGKFLSLQNSTFDNMGMLQKRDGYGLLDSLPQSATFLTTFNGNLTALGTSVQAYNGPSNTWVNKGSVTPLELSTLPLIRSNTNQIQADIALSTNGLVCTVYTDSVPVSGSPVSLYKFAVASLATGQNIVAPTVITPSSGTVVGSPKVFFLGSYFIIVFTNLISGVYHLKYIAVNSVNPTSVSADVNITSQYTPSSTVAWDGFVANNNLFLAWNGNDGGGAVRVTRLTSTLGLAATVVFATQVATIMTVTADASTGIPTVYVSYYNSGTSTGYTLAVSQNLDTILAPTQIIATGTVLNITSVADQGLCTVYWEVSNNYSYDSGVPTHFIRKRTVTQAGSLSSITVLARSVGLASKAFYLDGAIYVLGTYQSIYQPTYFLLNSSGLVVCKVAYGNGGGYLTTGIPDVAVSGSTAYLPYLVKDLIEATNKSLTAASSAPVYSQTGINLAEFKVIEGVDISTTEIGNGLQLSGGFIYNYDGYAAVENGFFLYPDDVQLDASTTDGTMTAQAYFYVATYEWADNQGNISRSAPSIPVTVTTTGSTSSVTVHVPTLRLTYKTANPVKIVVYRWSTAQQIFYQVTSITNPVLNSTTVDSVDFLDTQPDSAILGNNILYTTGGVLENIGAPAADNLTLFQSRLFYITSEDKNLLGFSKQVIENTPVETSDLLTIYVAPTVGAQSTGTGPMKVLSAMDDKLIVFKKDAIYYINGVGPDNTGANSQFSEPTFITATVGCELPHSVVFMPQGLMFQSDKGIWLLGRDLSTSYIGAPVEAATNSATVQSAVNVPGTNQVRFTMSSGITLMYDYYYGQWGTFVGVPAVSSTLYLGLHTYIDQYSRVFQETPGKYLDGSSPVLMSFTTSWFNLAGLQGYERAYYFYLLGLYKSPHKLNINIAYDYEASPSQTVLITPDNYSVPYGTDTLWGSTPQWGGKSAVEQWRIFMKTQKCQAFQITINEIYDPSMGAPAGAGFSLSGLNLVVGLKKGYRPIRSANSAG